MVRTKHDWERISAEYRGFLLRIARRRIGTRYAAKVGPESVVQEALTKAFQQRTNFRGTTNEELRAYLCTALENSITDRLRYVRRQKRNAGLEVPLADDRSSSGRAGHAASSRLGPERQAQDREEGQRVLALVAQLPPAQREVVELFHVDKLSVHEIGRRLGLSDAAVRGLRGRGNRRLRELIEAARKHG